MQIISFQKHYDGLLDAGGVTTVTTLTYQQLNIVNTNLSFSTTNYRRKSHLGQEHCYSQTEPISKTGNWGSPPNYLNISSTIKSTMEKLERRSGIRVQYLNITHLSGYRKDAHPSIHKNLYRPLTEEQLENPMSYADCIHWCLPGVPDVWNQILYGYIMNPHMYL